MAHPRKLIRHAVVALLAAANTAAGARVQGTRVEPHKQSQLPALSVYTLADPVNEDASTQTEDAHEVQLEIAGWVAHADSYPVDDAMDDLAEQVENAMRLSPFLGTAARMVRFLGTTMRVVEDDGRSDPLVGIVTLTFVVEYRSSKVADDPLDDFLQVDAKHTVTGGVVDTPTAEDLFNVQEP